MRKLYIFLLSFLISCSSSDIKNDINFSAIDNFTEFKEKLENYDKINLYPDIDE